MGGCVVSVMDTKNSRAVVDSKAFSAYNERLRGAKNSFLTPVEGTETANSSPIYHMHGIDSAQHAKLSKEYYQSPNCLQRMRELCSKRKDKILAAVRPVVEVSKDIIRDANGKEKTMEITHLGETRKYTYGEVWKKIDAFGRGLASLGIRSGSNIAIYHDTCLEWIIGIYGIWLQDMVAATVYANLGDEALAYALHETSSGAILCSGVNAAKVAKLMRSNVIPSVPVIYTGKLPAGIDTTGIAIYSFDEVISTGKEQIAAGTAEGKGPQSNDNLALIMYTSGTTGDPKGVIHTHGSIASGICSLTCRVNDLLGESLPDETYCAYLPMAHIMEFAVVNIFIGRGALIGFGSPRTLTSATARPHGDFEEFRPSVIVGVPRIFDTIKKAIESKLPAPGAIKRRVFDHAYASRLEALKQGKDTPYWNEKVFSTLRQILGGRASFFLAGGGPLSAVTHEFVNVVFGQCIAGYGLTETVCVGAIQICGDYEPYCIGVTEPGEQIKLMDTEFYKHTDKPEPRGELLTRGSYLFKGYYKQPELTKEAIDADGWFHTGDVASITTEGKIRIVGRVKALAKNANGEYIALEVLEAIYSSNALLLPNGACVLVNPHKNYITALALTDEGRAMAFAVEQGIEGTWPDILKDPKFNEAAAKSLAQTAKAARRAGFELVRHVRILADEWTPENGILTAAMKLRRKAVDERYATVINELFADE